MLYASYLRDVMFLQPLAYRNGMSMIVSANEMEVKSSVIDRLEPVKRKAFGRSRRSACQNFSRSTSLTRES